MDARKIESKVNPGGSGHDWVKNEFVEAVADLQRFREGRGVLGLLDEDGQGVASRRNEIAERLAARGLPPLDDAGGRCLLLPVRNLETWLYWLESHRCGRGWNINEQEDYKTNRPHGMSEKDTNEVCGRAGTFLHTLNHTNPPSGCPPMLALALRQLRAFMGAF